MHGLKFFVLWIVTGALVASLLLFMPQTFNGVPLLGTNNGLVQITLSTLTFSAGIGTLYYLVRRARHDEKLLDNANRQDRLKRLDSAADLLASDSETANTAGVGIITNLIVNHPEEFGRIGLQVLTAFISEKTRTEWDKHSETVNKAYGNPPPAEFQRTSTAVVRAIMNLGTIRAKFNAWPGRLPGYPELIVERSCLAYIEFRDLDLSQIDFSNLIAHRLTFKRCQLIGAEFRVVADDQLSFHTCDLTKARLGVADMGQKLFPAAGFLPELTFEDCNLANAMINDEAIRPGVHRC